MMKYDIRETTNQHGTTRYWLTKAGSDTPEGATVSDDGVEVGAYVQARFLMHCLNLLTDEQNNAARLMAIKDYNIRERDRVNADG